MQIWKEPEPIEVPPDLAGYVGGHPLAAELLVRRGIRTPAEARAFLDPGAYQPAPPEALPGLLEAAARVIRAIEAREKICVWGDFDVDGQTATALLVEALRFFGAEVIHHIPVRAAESHGINVQKLEEMIAQGARLILTCDTGSGEHESIAFANARGVDVVVTDHHKLSETPPPAAAFTNPQMLPEGHPLQTLPGVGVAWKLVEHLGTRLGSPEAAERSVDLAALGIVADVAELAGDTRWLLQRGLALLRENRRVGLRELYTLAGIDPSGIDAETIGFAIAPRLNALGRLDDANPVVEFLTTADVTRARVLAKRLEGLNGERRLITDQIYASALAMIEAEPAHRSGPVIVLAREGWEPGVIGIVASRLVEDFGLPAILVSIGPDGLGRGSARSIEGVDITAAIAQAADLLETYGGHTMAGGLSIRSDRIEEFRRIVSAAVRAQIPAGKPADRLAIDGYLGLDEIEIELIAGLDRLAPFGPGFPRPIFATRDLELRTDSLVGRSEDHRRVVVADRAENLQEVIWWGGGAEETPQARFDLAYTLGTNTYKGERRVQMTWLAAREREHVPGDRPRKRSGGPAVIDLRAVEDPDRELERLRTEGRLAVWGRDEERPPAPDSAGTRTLAVWTVPPGPDVLRELLDRYQPEQVALFGNPPPDSDVDSFLRRLAGLLKYAQRIYNGRISTRQLAEATRQTPEVLEAGLAWLVESGHFSVERENEMLRTGRGTGQTAGKLAETGSGLKRLLEETRAFGRYYLEAPAESLLEGRDSERSRR